PRRAIRPPDRPPPAAKLVRGAPPPGLGRHANGLGLALRGLPRLLPSPGTAGTATRVAVCELRGRVRDRLGRSVRSEEHTSELQSRGHLVCRLLLEKKIENCVAWRIDSIYYVR